MIIVGVIGFGYWGPNIVRNIMSIEGMEVLYIVDKSIDRLKDAKKLYPSISVTQDFNDSERVPNEGEVYAQVGQSHGGNIFEILTSDGEKTLARLPKKFRKRETITFSSKFSCPESGFTIEEIEPRLFSFNSPYGACEECEGIGHNLNVDPNQSRIYI